MKKFYFPPLYPGKQKKVHNSKVCSYKKICSCSALQHNPRAMSIKGLYAKMAKLSYIRQINRGNELLLLKESKVRLKVILSG